MSARNKIFAILLVLLTIAVIALVLIAPPKFLGFAVPTKAPKDKNGGEPEVSASNIVINEFMSSNSGAVVDENGDDPDWFELYNPGDEDVRLDGYTLTNNPQKSAKYVFSNTVIPAHGHLLIFATGSATVPNPDAAYIHVPFKLKIDQTLLLADNAGLAADSVNIPQLTKNHSVGRVPDGGGDWQEFAEPTPGFPNTPEGRQAYLDSLQSNILGLYINELTASNHTTITDKDGDYSDWIELYNGTEAKMDLSGFGLSDKPDHRMRCRFSQGTAIEPGEYLLVFASGKSDPFGTSAELHAPFKLAAYEGTVLLCDPAGKIVDSADYQEMQADQAYARSAGDRSVWEYTMKPTPGYENSDAGYTEFQKQSTLKLGPLTISQVMTSNNTLLETDGEHFDWLELHNASSETIDLSRYGLTNNTKNPAKWRFPEGASIEGGGYLVVLCSGRNNKSLESKKKYYETSFKLSSQGEIVALYDPSGSLLDRYNVPSLPSGVSYGRSGAQMVYYDNPKPGGPGEGGYAGITASPSFSDTPGIYDGSMQISLTAGEGEAIYYTTDYTTPTANSQRYSGPISVDKNTVIRAVSVKEGYLTGPAVSGTFLLKSDGADHALPVVSLVTDPQNLWDSKTGIYAYGDSYDPEEDFPRPSANYYKGKSSETEQAKWERKVNFSLFGDDGKQAFTQDVGMRIAGSYGRGNAQKGLNLIARAEYGKTRMDYPFFNSREYQSYKAVVLRAGGQDQPQSKIRDELSTGLLENTDVNVLYQAYRPCVVYLNGEYWGVYFLKEKRNRFFVAQHENVSEDLDFDLIKSAKQVNYGSSDDWKKIMEYVNSHDLSNADAYARVADEIDVNSFMDYMICEIYVANSDTWNIQYYKLPGGKWKWIYYDFCWSWGNTTNGVDHQTLAIRRQSDKPCFDLFNALLKNKGWKDAFVRRMAELFKTVYAPERVNALADELIEAIEPELVRERQKFNASTFMGVKQAPQTVASADVDKWLNTQVKKIRDFAEKRQNSLIEQLENELGLSDAYMQEVFGVDR